MSSAVVVAVALGLVPPAAAAKDNRAANLVINVVAANLKGQYGKIWPSLHPTYRAVTTRAFWEGCQRKRSEQRAGAQLLSVKVIETYSDGVKLPLLGMIPVTAVTVTVRVKYLGEALTITDTLYVTKRSGRLYGLWEPETYRAYKANRCPPT